MKLFRRKSDIGLVIDWPFHKANQWYVALTPYLINQVIDIFNPRIISNQEDYDSQKHNCTKIISIELGIPKIKYDVGIQCKKYLFHSDPHYEVQKRSDYFIENRFDYVLSFYKSPFFYHNPDFDKKKFIHFPWSIPDEFIRQDEILVRNSDVVIFGAAKHDAYDVRNWCRQQPGVTNFNYSGVENKQLVGKPYFDWIRQFDAIIAAGSSSPEFDLVTPKYFEIAASGALLFGQYCEDLSSLGFDETNSVIFTKNDFLEKLDMYKSYPQKYLEIRRNGRALILARHKLSDRIKLLKELLRD